MQENPIKLGRPNSVPRICSRKFSKKSVLAFAFTLIAIPATLWITWKLADRRYYMTSMLILIYTMVPFAVAFEHRKPQARELVVLAVMCALAIAARTLFIWLPNFKPMAAIILLTGVAFGPEAGFLCGAIAALGSNLIFGQGPWTPWQMTAFGVAGFLAGLVFQKGLLRPNRLPLCIFGGIVTLFVIGPILDTSTLFIMFSVPNLKSALAVYTAGFPVNLMQTIATVLTLFLISRSLLEKLDRIKTKYGLMEG